MAVRPSLSAARRPARRVLLPLALAAATVLAACGSQGSANPDPSTPSVLSSSSSVAATTGTPSITVPGLTSGGSATPSSAGSSVQVSTSGSPTAVSSPAPTRTSPTSRPAPTTTRTTPAPPTTAERPPTTPTTAEPPTTPTTTRPTTTAPPTTTRAPAPPATTPKPNTGGTMTRKVVVIDPGHNGANKDNPDIINKLVDAGFGQRKPCNTTGTETNAGYTEAQFNWRVATRVRDILQSRGITVIMTRSSNDGVGPCVNQRAAIGNENEADAVVSIHGDGDEASANGFYVMTAAQDPAGAQMAATSSRLADDVRDSLVGTGFSPSNHLGSDGLWKRDDLAGLNLSVRPTVMLEMGNMRNAGDAATMSSSDGQQRYAEGIAQGVVQFLIGN